MLRCRFYTVFCNLIHEFRSLQVVCQSELNGWMAVCLFRLFKENSNWRNNVKLKKNIAQRSSVIPQWFWALAHRRRMNTWAAIGADHRQKLGVLVTLLNKARTLSLYSLEASPLGFCVNLGVWNIYLFVLAANLRTKLLVFGQWLIIIPGLNVPNISQVWLWSTRLKFYVYEQHVLRL